VRRLALAVALLIVTSALAQKAPTNVRLIVQAPPDGTTLFVASSGMITFSPHYEKSLPYDVARAGGRLL
jgi:hypothetical protein